MRLAHYVNRLLSKMMEQLYVSIQNQRTISFPLSSVMCVTEQMRLTWWKMVSVLSDYSGTKFM